MVTGWFIASPPIIGPNLGNMTGGKLPNGIGNKAIGDFAYRRRGLRFAPTLRRRHGRRIGCDGIARAI
jgi:hypothetical protein